jgi:arylsulfatase
MNTWPDAAMTPFRGEKDTGWEGAFRVPFFVRWTGHILAGQISNAVMSHMDWLPTLLDAAGVPDVKEKLLSGYRANGKRVKAHLDGVHPSFASLPSSPSPFSHFYPLGRSSQKRYRA